MNQSGPTGSIHVVLTFDANFWAPAYATMRSICATSKRRREIVFYLLHLGLNSDQRRDLEEICTEYGAALDHTDVAATPVYRDLAARLPKQRKPFAALLYTRLCIDQLLPNEVTRFIYVDCDTLFRAPIEELEATDLQGRPIAAVLDPHAWLLCNGRDVRQNWALFDPASPYFNSGLILVDRAGWQAANPKSVLDSLIESGRLQTLFYDQAVLNIAFRDNWLPLDQMWNYSSPHRAFEGLNPRMVHYTGRRKPWKLRSSAPFERIYRHVMTNELFYRYLRFRWARWWQRKLSGRR
jgi:lipopolysaccharide biosynthesis glycosyltransferase